MRKPVYFILTTLLAIAFTVYISLDTFVISHVSTVVAMAPQYSEAGTPSASRSLDTASVTAAAENASASAEEADSSEAPVSSTVADSPAESSSSPVTPVVTDTEYRDENITICLNTYRQYDTTIYVADIQLSAANYLKTAFAQSAYGKNVTAPTSETASAVGAILAINGDYYGVQERGYVLKNGVIYRSAKKSGQQDLAIYEDGSMQIICEDDITAEELLESGVRDILCFGPGLITDGEISVTTDDEVAKAMTSNPRTALGIVSPLHYLFVVADGRTSESAGLSLYQLAEFMQSLGTQTAYNLDGGGSSTMVFNGNLVNQPASSGRHGFGSSSSNERSVSDIVYIGY